MVAAFANSRFKIDPEDSRNFGAVQAKFSEFFHLFETVDETWIHHYTLASKQTIETRYYTRWINPKSHFIFLSVNKVKAIFFFWIRKELLLLITWRSVKPSGQYFPELLQCLNDVVKNKWFYLAKEKILFHDDNVIAMRGSLQWLKSTNWNLSSSLNQI